MHCNCFKQGVVCRFSRAVIIQLHKIQSQCLLICSYRKYNTHTQCEKEKKEQNQQGTESWKQTSSVVWLMFKRQLLDNGTQLIISISKEVIFLCKVCISLDLQYNLFYLSLTSCLLSRMLFWRKEMFGKILNILVWCNAFKYVSKVFIRAAWMFGAKIPSNISISIHRIKILSGLHEGNAVSRPHWLCSWLFSS